MVSLGLEKIFNRLDSSGYLVHGGEGSRCFPAV